MLVSFSVTNYKSIRDTVTLQFSPGKSRTKSEHISTDDCLMVTAIFGSNSFGKSNIINAIKMLKNLVTVPFYYTEGPVFNWNNYNNQTTGFEIVFNHDGDQYEYNLEVCPSHRSNTDKKYTPGRGEAPRGYTIVRESLSVIPKVGSVVADCSDLDKYRTVVFDSRPDFVSEDDAMMVIGIKEEIDEYKTQLQKNISELDSLVEMRTRYQNTIMSLEDRIKSTIKDNLITIDYPSDAEIDLIFQDLVSYMTGSTVRFGSEGFETANIDYAKMMAQSPIPKDELHSMYPKVDCVDNPEQFRKICMEYLKTYIQNALFDDRYKTLVESIRETKLTIRALQGELPKRATLAKKSIPILLSKNYSQDVTDLEEEKFKDIVNKVYAWFASSLIVIGTTDFHIPTNSIDYMSKLSEVTSSLDVGIQRLEWVELKDKERLDYEIKAADRQRLEELKRYSLDNYCETATIVSTSSGLYRFKYWCGEESVREIRVWHAHDRGFGFPLSMESDGTRRIIELVSMLLPTQNEKTYIVDEIDRRLHPLMTNRLIRMFMDMNPGNKQLVFTTHEMRLLTTDIFRKDEIWFVTKKNGDSELTPLDEIKTFDKRIEKMYMEGRLPGAPNLSELRDE